MLDCNFKILSKGIQHLILFYQSSKLRKTAKAKDERDRQNSIWGGGGELKSGQRMGLKVKLMEFTENREEDKRSDRWEMMN